jgi:hypothetical protein
MFYRSLGMLCATTSTLVMCISSAKADDVLSLHCSDVGYSFFSAGTPPVGPLQISKVGGGDAPFKTYQFDLNLTKHSMTYDSAEYTITVGTGPIYILNPAKSNRFTPEQNTIKIDRRTGVYTKTQDSLDAPGHITSTTVDFGICGTAKTRF